MNSFIIETEDYSLREIAYHRLLEQKGFVDSYASIYDLENTTLENALEDLDTYGLFSDQKIIVIRGIENYKVSEDSKTYDHLIKYLSNPNPLYLLVFEVDKFNNTLKIAKDLKKYCEMVPTDYSSKAYIKDCMKDYQISQDTINLLDEYCLSDFTKIHSECEKLKNYKINDKKITSDDVKSLVSKKLGDPRDLTFAFSRSIGLRDKEDAFKKYHDLLQYQIDALSILGLLGSQIRIIYQVKLLVKKHLSDKEIGELLGEKEFRIKKTRELIPYYTEEDCLSFMRKLSDIDLKIKSTDTDSNRELELFLLNL